MRLIENNTGSINKKVYRRIYWAERNVFRSAYYFMSMCNIRVSNHLKDRIYNEINRE